MIAFCLPDILMRRRSLILVLASLSALTLPLAAQIFTSKPATPPDSETISALLQRRGYRHLGDIRKRGDVYLVSATSARGDRRQLVVASDGTIVGERPHP
ncbi:MAG: hypothetical protein K2X10_12545 [Hyphomicrobiales bacterium]|nr:hypothetical protein [Hyphomicrobiales bacterium]OQW82974.1 MAG: hypothetical protein BVN31_06620 [Proteobacteria bacterium ST_bin15]